MLNAKDAAQADSGAGSKPPRIAIVGCGAIVELQYLPAMAKYPALRDNMILVDANGQRVRDLATQFQIADYTCDYREVLTSVQGAIIATPHHLHYPIGMDFLAHGVHVLSEKPLAESATEARDMVVQAHAHQTTLSVNHMRRLAPMYRKVKQILEQNVIGIPRFIQYIDGEVFSWPTASGFYFKKASPAGVLLDRGVHSLDLICWWLGGKPEVIASQNDSFGGMEGTADLQLAYRDCRVEVKLSWLNRLQNTYTIIGDKGSLHGRIDDWQQVTIEYNSGKKEQLKLKATEKDDDAYWEKTVTHFAEVARGAATPLIAGQDVLPCIELIEECYQAATRLPLPWYDALEVAYA